MSIWILSTSLNIFIPNAISFAYEIIHEQSSNNSVSFANIILYKKIITSNYEQCLGLNGVF